MTALLSIGLDVVILIALGVTIFYTVTLSRRLNVFRSQRKEFEGLINELSANIARAQDSIAELKEASLATGEQLHRKVKDAQMLQDELEQILVSGENLADRLEAGILGDKAEGGAAAAKVKKAEFPQSKAQKKSREEVDDLPAFFIQDIDDDDAGAGDEDQSLWDMADDDSPSREPANTDEPHRSQAEIELMNALKRKRKS